MMTSSIIRLDLAIIKGDLWPSFWTTDPILFLLENISTEEWGQDNTTGSKDAAYIAYTQHISIVPDES